MLSLNVHTGLWWRWCWCFQPALAEKEYRATALNTKGAQCGFPALCIPGIALWRPCLNLWPSGVCGQPCHHTAVSLFPALCLPDRRESKQKTVLTRMCTVAQPREHVWQGKRQLSGHPNCPWGDFWFSTCCTVVKLKKRRMKFLGFFLSPTPVTHSQHPARPSVLWLPWPCSTRPQSKKDASLTVWGVFTQLYCTFFAPWPWFLPLSPEWENTVTH